MGRLRRHWSEETLKDYLQQGRGQGTGSSYKPWIYAREFPSLGRATGIGCGWKTGRPHELLSDNERRLFFLLEWSDTVVDIREQFPLLDLELAQRVAEEADVRYPVDPSSKFPRVLTTDFVVTVKRGGQLVNLVRTVKPRDDLEAPRKLELLEIDRRYWSAKGWEWAIVVAEELPRALAENIGYFHSAYWLDPVEAEREEERAAALDVLMHRLRSGTKTIAYVTKRLDAERGLEPGASLRLFMHLVARKRVLLDMHVKFTPAVTMEAIKCVFSEGEKSWEGETACN